MLLAIGCFTAANLAIFLRTAFPGRRIFKRLSIFFEIPGQPFGHAGKYL
jgi:hypothetical protein